MWPSPTTGPSNLGIQSPSPSFQQVTLHHPCQLLLYRYPQPQGRGFWKGHQQPPGYTDRPGPQTASQLSDSLGLPHKGLLDHRLLSTGAWTLERQALLPVPTDCGASSRAAARGSPEG